jgi:hypothetical protein
MVELNTPVLHKLNLLAQFISCEENVVLLIWLQGLYSHPFLFFVTYG